MIQIDNQLMNEMLRHANKLGYSGKRIIGWEYKPAESATQQDSYQFIIDDGPQTATETW